MEIVHAAAHLEKIQGIIGKFFRRGAGWKRAVVERAPAQAAQAGGDGRARVFIFEVQLEQGREAQAEAVGVGPGESLTKRAVEHEAGFEIGASGGVLDGMHPVAQVQPSRLFRRPEKTLQAATQVGGLADVGLGLGIVAAEEEDCRRRGSGGENFRIAIGNEFQALSQHLGILV